MDEDTRKACDKIEKLMRLAGSNPNEAEAASALAKAQQLLLAYNLDMAVVEQASGQSGKRTSDMVKGGMHKYQRRLWQHIAELNFCMYWSQKNRVTDATRWYKAQKFIFQHRVLGREANVIATKNMAEYIGQTIMRLCQEKFLTTNYFKLSSPDAIAYREGIADRVIEKIADRRQEAVDAEERKAAEDARRASKAGTSSATAMTIAGLSEIEEQGNYDHLHGEGAWAKRKQWEADYEKRWAERRAAQAKADRDAEAEHAKWAAAHPEEAAREAKKEAARQRAEERREMNRRPRRYRFRQTGEEMRRSSGSYHAGYAKGDEVGIDPQMDSGSSRRIAR